LYGGGGVYPDVLLPDTLWLSRMQESDVVAKWAGAYVSMAGSGLPELDQLLANGLPESAIDQFRTFAAQERFDIPKEAAVTSLLKPMLLRALAYVRWGNAGFYRAAALTDPQTAAAAQYFDRARSLMTNHAR
jgi:hypothetical protein